MTFFLTVFVFLLPLTIQAACPVYDSRNIQMKGASDGVATALKHATKCPLNVLEWNALLKSQGLSHGASMVANRGRNNPALGSFSLFETVTGPNTKKGEFFYGHFTDKHQHKIVLDQNPGKGKLLIELIAWDHKKEAFNFYELIGLDEKTSRWFYRGDSFDALKDNEFLYRNNRNQPKFGQRMRCSACHNSGGPIMKELSYPHNDWWTTRRSLTFGDATLDVNVSEYVKQLVPAEKFSQAVKTGIHKLENSFKYQQAKSKLSLQEQLRPLFCEQEINLESDNVSNSMGNSHINIPSGFFINPLLQSKSIKISRVEYENLLAREGLRFPETEDQDGDHAWLTPVKGYSDLLAIQSLIKNKVVSLEFVKTILEIEAKSPLFSKRRCELLKKVPDHFVGWERTFMTELHKETIPIQNQSFESVFLKLLNIRQAVYESEISQNPRGQILEPGFRVIFPK